MPQTSRFRSTEPKMYVFVNCPFDAKYRKLFHASLFTVLECGFVARSALELNDASLVRIVKILKIIRECPLGIHDLSRTELSKDSRLPRFNMPLELGIFLGAKEYGDAAQRQKQCLILDREPHRYQKFCSDIAGQDISAHGNDVTQLISVVRDFLRSARPEVMIPGGTEIFRRYQLFRSKLPSFCLKLGILQRELTFNDFTMLATACLTRTP